MSPDPDDESPDEPAPSEQLEIVEPDAGETPTVDAGTRKGVRKQVISKARREKQATEFWQAMFSTPVGRREMWTILNDLHPFETMYGISPGGFPDPTATAAHMAVQQHGLGLFLKWQNRDPEGIRIMLLENDPRFAKAK